MAAVAGAAVRHGIQAQVGIVNPATVLATRNDREALAWTAANVAPGAVFLVNGWNWQGELWASSDSGAWLTPLTGQATTLPPLDYSFGPPEWRQGVEAFNREVGAMDTADQAPDLELLARRGVTHVFIGARGGPLRPEVFVSSAGFRLLFTNGAGWVFAVGAPSGAANRAGQP
jgi:hypothetical protein